LLPLYKDLNRASDPRGSARAIAFFSKLGSSCDSKDAGTNLISARHTVRQVTDVLDLNPGFRHIADPAH
jgi:hypothetical protein